MRNSESFNNRDRLIQIGLSISALRKYQGLSQEQLAEKAGISRSFLSMIENPNTVRAFSLDIFFNISDALNVNPSKLLASTLIPENDSSKP